MLRASDSQCNANGFRTVTERFAGAGWRLVTLPSCFKRSDRTVDQTKPQGPAFPFPSPARTRLPFIASSDPGVSRLGGVPLWETVYGSYRLPIPTAIALSFRAPPMHQKKVS